MKTAHKLFAAATVLSLFGAGCFSAAPAQPANGPTATIHITSTGFQPTNITIKAGTTITFVNDDNAPHWPASGEHPTHTILPGFDALRALTQGETYSFTFDKVGAWPYHDHLHPDWQGTITVVQ
jgi:plastocyanin